MVSAVESLRSLPLLYCASATLLTGELTYTGNRDHNRVSAHTQATRGRSAATLDKWPRGQLAAVDNWRPDFRRHTTWPPWLCQARVSSTKWPRRTTGSHANRLRRLSNW